MTPGWVWPSVHWMDWDALPPTIYYHLSNGQWVYSSLGAGAYNVRDGDVEGWVWGVSTQQGGAQPPAISFDQICTPAATDTPVPPTPTSVPPTTTPTLLPSAQAWFRLDANPVPLGVCTTVRWDASYVDYVFLGDESVDISGSREICPDGPVDLTLLVGNEYSKQTYTLTLGVTIADDGAATLSPTATPTSQPVSHIPARERYYPDSICHGACAFAIRRGVGDFRSCVDGDTSTYGDVGAILVFGAPRQLDKYTHSCHGCTLPRDEQTYLYGDAFRRADDLAGRCNVGNPDSIPMDKVHGLCRDRRSPACWVRVVSSPA